MRQFGFLYHGRGSLRRGNTGMACGDTHAGQGRAIAGSVPVLHTGEIAGRPSTCAAYNIGWRYRGGRGYSCAGGRNERAAGAYFPRPEWCDRHRRGALLQEKGCGTGEICCLTRIWKICCGTQGFSFYGFLWRERGQAGGDLPFLSGRGGRVSGGTHYGSF